MTTIRNTDQILTQAQIAELRNLFDAKKVQDQTIGGLWSEVYERLYGFITDYYAPIGQVSIGADLNPIPDMPKEGIDKQTWLWLRGARFINAGAGPFAALIRETTIIQHRLRYGDPATQIQMDEASNSIARNFLGQWLGYDVPNQDFVSPPVGGTQPDISEAAAFDAGPAAAKIFNRDNMTKGDAAGWAGTLLWGNLGDLEPWRDMVLKSLLNPLSPGQYRDLPETQDIGSYNAIAAAAAVEEFSVLNSVPGFLAHYDEVVAVFAQQFGYRDTVDLLAAQTNAAFRELYGLGAGDPNPTLGSDTFGITEVARFICTASRDF